MTTSSNSLPKLHHAARHQRRRRGLSLIEMIIATALLAGSALLIQSLIGAGTRYGTTAELRTMAVTLAETALNDAMTSTASSNREVTEPFAHAPEWSYRLRQSPIDNLPLVQWTVDIFQTKDVEGSATNESSKPIFTLVRWQRRSPESDRTSRSRGLRP